MFPSSIPPSRSLLSAMSIGPFAGLSASASGSRSRSTRPLGPPSSPGVRRGTCESMTRSGRPSRPCTWATKSFLNVAWSPRSSSLASGAVSSRRSPNSRPRVSIAAESVRSSNAVSEALRSDAPAGLPTRSRCRFSSPRIASHPRRSCANTRKSSGPTVLPATPRSSTCDVSSSAPAKPGPLPAVSMADKQASTTNAIQRIRKRPSIRRIPHPRSCEERAPPTAARPVSLATTMRQVSHSRKRERPRRRSDYSCVARANLIPLQALIAVR